MEDLVIFDRYAGDVIAGAPDQFDAIEIQGVRLVSGSQDEYTIDNVNPTMTSVYLHQKEGGVQCCGDFTEREQAQLYAAELSAEYHWRIHDYTHSDLASEITT